MYLFFHNLSFVYLMEHTSYLSKLKWLKLEITRGYNFVFSKTKEIDDDKDNSEAYTIKQGVFTVHFNRYILVNEA